MTVKIFRTLNNIHVSGKLYSCRSKLEYAQQRWQKKCYGGAKAKLSKIAYLFFKSLARGTASLTYKFLIIQFFLEPGSANIPLAFCACAHDYMLQLCGVRFISNIESIHRRLLNYLVHRDDESYLPLWYKTIFLIWTIL